MEDNVQVSPEDKELQDSNIQVTQEQDVDPIPNLDQVLQDQEDQRPEKFSQEQESLHTGSPQDQDQDQDQDQVTAAANQDEAGESGGVVPALVVTQVEECPPAAETLEPLVSPEEPWEPQRPERPSDLVIPAAPNMSSDLSLSSSSDGGDMTCSDLLSLRSDSLSLASDPTVSRRSEEDDTRSVTASSVMAADGPLEKAWLRSCAEGNMAAQRQLLTQDPGLVLKKVVVAGGGGGGG
ncbi:hypothetical protein INR49_009067, partial [Caranx melampygus]